MSYSLLSILSKGGIGMNKWIDILPGSWYFNEVIEASNIFLEDGEPFIQGIPYNVFDENAPFIYEEIDVVNDQKIFYLDHKIQPTVDNPLFVYINGVQTVYQDVVIEDNKTKVTLYTPAIKGSVVSFASYGIPKLDDYNRPLVTSSDSISYPSYKLKNSDKYYFNPFYRNNRESLFAYGKQLKRLNIEDREWERASDIQDLLRKHIGYSTDVYSVSPDGVVYLPYNLNRVSCKIIYLYNDKFVRTATETFKPESTNVLFVNRFFPNTLLSRAEAFTLLNRLRQTFYSRYTDIDAPDYIINSEVVAFAGQRAVSVGQRYPSGEGKLDVYLNSVKCSLDIDYIEFDQYTVLFKRPLEEGDVVNFYYKKTKSKRLVDVGTRTKYYRVDNSKYIDINGTVDNENTDDDSWWAKHVLALEEELLDSGENLIDGVPVLGVFEHDGVKTVPVDSNLTPVQQGDGGEIWFMPNSFLTRAEAVTILNRFRKLCMEKFL